MRYNARLRKEYPRSLIQLAGTTIRAGALNNYQCIRIYNFPTDNLSGPFSSEINIHSSYSAPSACIRGYRNGEI
ncbi:MAG: hypothetical protein BWY45_01012 [Euryarchaeota archaeon ADurb.Bin294]|jgi:hypothetical protein|nr:MAG: hypothetical protein BWY45_01012 [Euryarchaeota archaeon ADurb.Bin294]